MRVLTISWNLRLVFQNPALLASLTVEENVGFLLREQAQLSRDEIRDRVYACLESVGLDDVAELYAGELSGGMQKRVIFARALIDHPQRGDQSMSMRSTPQTTPMSCSSGRLA